MINLDKYIQSIVSYLLPDIDKEEFIVRGLVIKTQAMTKRKHTDIQNPVAGQNWQSDKGQDGVWERQIQTKVAGKDLTSTEVNDILLAGLDLGKAAIIKSAMATMKAIDTQESVSGKLQKEYGRGYSVSSISPYWKILAPPLPAE
jgi:hypothetical protein